MKKTLPYLIISVILLSAASCRKDEHQPVEQTTLTPAPTPAPAPTPIDTIFPGDYFPAHPESYWNYDNGMTYTVDPGYHYYSIPYYIDYPGGELAYNTYYLPTFRIDGNPKPIKKYAFLASSNNQFSAFFSETSEGWSHDTGNPSGGTYHNVITRDTSIEVNGVIMDSLVLVNRGYANAPPSYNQYFYNHSYFKKDVGIVRFDFRSTSDSIEHSIHLTDYYINN